jgi:hypothetical protein
MEGNDALVTFTKHSLTNTCSGLHNSHTLKIKYKYIEGIRRKLTTVQMQKLSIMA